MSKRLSTESALRVFPSLLFTGLVYAMGSGLLLSCKKSLETVEVDNPLIDPLDDFPAAGTVETPCGVPAEAGLEDVSTPDIVIGDGTPESCTGEDFRQAVSQGGIITFNCGDAPHTITLTEPAKVVNDASPEVVIDGGGLITLDGDGETRMIYMNTCDQNQVWTSSRCDNQDHPRLTVQNLTFINGDSQLQSEHQDDEGGGGAIWVRGGRFKVVNCRFFNNISKTLGPDVGGGALRVFSQYEGRPVYVVNTTFGGREGLGNISSNGGGISSIGVSWILIHTVFTHNQAIGNGGNPAEPSTPGGGSGGAIYNDGNEMTLSLCGCRLENNEVNTHGSAIFFVSNDKTGILRIDRSTIRNNLGGDSWYELPGISMHPETRREITRSVIEE